MFSVPETVYKVLCESTFAVPGTVPQHFQEWFQVRVMWMGVTVCDLNCGNHLTEVWHHKNDFSNIMNIHHLFGTNMYEKKNEQKQTTKTKTK